MVDALKAYLDDVKEIVFVVNRDYKVVYRNKVFSRYFSGNAVDDFVVDVEGFKAFVSSCNEAKSTEFEFRTVGGIRKLKLKAYPEKDYCLIVVEVENIFEKISEESVQGVFVIQDGKFKYVNPVAERVTKYTKDELYSINPLSLISEDHRETVKEHYNRVLEGERVPAVEISYYTKDGEQRWVLMSATRIEYEGKPAILGNWFDITRIKTLEEELRVSEEKYRDLVENTLIGVYIVTVDGDMILANRALANILETPLEEIYKMKTTRFYKNKEDRKRFLRKLREEGRVYGFETKIVTGKGREIDVVISAKLEGNIITGSLMDISYRKQLEERIKEEKEFAEKVIDTANAMIVGLDSRGRIVIFNRKCEELTGLKREKVYGKSWFEFLPPESRKNAVKTFEEIKKGNLVSFVDHVSTLEGEKTFYWTNTLVKRGRQKLVISVGVDVTEELKAKRRAEELVEVLSLINKILRHDISNDLSVILGILEILKTEYKPELVNIGLKTIERSLELISEMRSFESAVEGGELKEVDVREVAEKVSEAFTVHINIEGNGKVYADEGLQSVFSNIIRNAILHGKTDRIDIRIREVNGFCEIRIVDYGKGIPDKEKEKIFEEGYFYGESGRTGMGLYIVKKIVDRYGGYVWVEDNKPRGAIFVINLRSAG
jgi:two-component system sensor kinase